MRDPKASGARSGRTAPSWRAGGSRRRRATSTRAWATIYADAAAEVFFDSLEVTPNE